MTDKLRSVSEKENYIVVATNYLPTLEEIVNRLIGEGLEPLGGISVVPDVQFHEDESITRDIMYHQAMVRTEESRNKIEERRRKMFDTITVG